MTSTCSERPQRCREQNKMNSKTTNKLHLKKIRLGQILDNYTLLFDFVI